MTHKKHYHSRQPDFLDTTKVIAGATVKVVEINALSNVGVAALNALKK